MWGMKLTIKVQNGNAIVTLADGQVFTVEPLQTFEAEVTLEAPPGVTGTPASAYFRAADKLEAPRA
jgi:hypothetical protein